MADSTLSLGTGSTDGYLNSTVYTSSGTTADNVTLSDTTANPANSNKFTYTNIGINTADGNDTVTVTNVLYSDRSVDKDNWSLRLGAADDSLVIDPGPVTGYNLQASTGNDTIVINGSANNTVVNGGIGSDSLVLTVGSFTNGIIAAVGGNVATKGQIVTDGADTIVIGDNTAVTGSTILNFSITGGTGFTDTLEIGAQGTKTAFTITADDLAGVSAGTYGTGNLISGSSADIAALNDWLTTGTNKITLI